MMPNATHALETRGFLALAIFFLWVILVSVIGCNAKNDANLFVDDRAELY